MKLEFPWRHSAITILCAIPIFGQSKVDLRTQTKSVDFSGALATKPAKIGASLPAACGQGEFFFLTSAPSGQNVYGCSAVNTWALEGAAVPQTSLVPAETNNSGKLLTTDGNNPIWQSIGGDVSGSPATLTVGALRGKPLSTVTPTDGQLMKFNGTTNVWEAIALTGDIHGNPATVTVNGLQGRGLSSAVPVNGQLLKFNGVAGIWEPVALGGDVSGAPSALTVSGLQGRGVSVAVPANGQLLKFNGVTGMWEPVAVGGDVSGAPSALTVSGLQGRGVSVAVPANGQLLKFNGVTGMWEPVAIGGDISGAPSALTVSALQGRVISNAIPLTGQLLGWSTASSTWTPTTLQIPPNYGGGFTNITTLTIPGTQHNLNTSNLLVSCYDAASPANLVEPNHVTIDPLTYNVTITFATPQSGRCLVNGSGGVGMGATSIKGSATLSFPTIGPATCSTEMTMSVPGALPADGIAEGWPGLPAGFIGMARVSANDTVAIRICNFSGGSVTPPAFSYSATIVRPF